MDETTITSWEQFVRIAEAFDLGDSVEMAYAFRGQSDSAWELQPSLLRILSQYEISEERALAIEAQALTEFRSQAHLHISLNVLSTTTDTISWWTLMQQHGAPTRLLDWCGSMFVAAYFAVTSQPRVAGSVWVVHINTVQTLMAEKYEGVSMPKTESAIQEQFLRVGGLPAIELIMRKSKTERMVVQQGGFSVCRNVLGNHGMILQDIMPDQSAKVYFRKLVIPASLKSPFLRKLRSMNITANSLFPGLDGLGRYIKEYIQVIGK